MLCDLKIWASALKRDVHAIYLATYDPRVPWYVKTLALAIAGYAVSPVDLIPDFIPVLGQLDDLIIVPFGIWLVVSLIPNEIMAEYRAMADATTQRPRGNGAAIMVIAIWLLGAAMLGWVAFARWGRAS